MAVGVGRGLTGIKNSTRFCINVEESSELGVGEAEDGVGVALSTGSSVQAPTDTSARASRLKLIKRFIICSIPPTSGDGYIILEMGMIMAYGCFIVRVFSVTVI